MPENHEIFLRHIEEIFGTAGLIKKHDCHVFGQLNHRGALFEGWPREEA